jgi:hypothetical protein
LPNKPQRSKIKKNKKTTFFDNFLSSQTLPQGSLKAQPATRDGFFTTVQKLAPKKVGFCN